jgi:hypothetical protein
MRLLLDNRLAPLTRRIGFGEVPFDVAVESHVTWRKGHAHGLKISSVQGPLDQVLPSLDPLSAPRTRELVLETRSGWTALFDNSIGGGDPGGFCSDIVRVQQCHAVWVSCSPSTIKRVGEKWVGEYGGVQFVYMKPDPTDPDDYLSRSIGLTNDGNRWEFEQLGEVQPFEQPERYLARKKTDRFTPEMLESYCAALGIRLFDPAFYGPRGLLLTNEYPTAPHVRVETLREVQENLGIR